MAQLLAGQNVNHETWHQGDPVPPAMQKWITANGYKTSDIYQGPDGWHYQRNEKTLESPEIMNLRLAEAAQQPVKQAADIVTGASPDPANAKVTEKILADWHKAGAASPPASSAAQPIAGTSEAAIPESANDNVAAPLEAAPASSNASSSGDQNNASTADVNAQRAALETVATAIDKLKRNEKLDPQESSLLSGVQQTARANGLDLDLSKLDPDMIRRASGIYSRADPAGHTLLAATAVPLTATDVPATAEALVPGIVSRSATALAEFAGATSTAILAPIATFLYVLLHPSEMAADQGLPIEPAPVPKTGAPESAVDDLPPPTTPAIPPLPPLIPPKDPSGHSSVPPPPPAIPEKLRPLINVIPLGEGFFTKPIITPGWHTIPEITGNGILENRKGNEQTIRRVNLCGQEWANILESKGYKVTEVYGGTNPEHYYPNPVGPNLTGGAWGDYTIYAKSPADKEITVTFNTYTARANGVTPTKIELRNAERLVSNWRSLIGNTDPQLSDAVLEDYEWLEGAFGMIAKGKNGPENDAEFLKACREEILSMFDENGRVKTTPEVKNFGDMK
ncbi:MAG TPA: hypothetical protein VGM59_08640 [Dongiaceae bacterium]